MTSHRRPTPVRAWTLRLTIGPTALTVAHRRRTFSAVIFEAAVIVHVLARREESSRWGTVPGSSSAYILLNLAASWTTASGASLCRTVSSMFHEKLTSIRGSGRVDVRALGGWSFWQRRAASVAPRWLSEDRRTLRRWSNLRRGDSNIPVAVEDVGRF